ncbi:type II toxin-antitoxin system HicB family antitoxin [Corynebacterium vitaeruminis]|uniref:type II toxin-antitoxin system HicB family antitoxin n=1 Tax=Corynebacterium vitaeruminis TaxID=38305 RepID=UPI0023F2C122|nr:type II toxin-antitoxin system HicB family antitoxin [Corynebacterium vitaeruminis]
MVSLVEKYTYQTFWSAEDEEFVSTVLEFPSLSWLGESSSAAETGLRQVVSEVISDMEKSGEPVPEPYGEREYSGRFNLRIPSSLHRRLAMAAEREGVSLNAYVAQKLATVE